MNLRSLLVLALAPLLAVAAASQSAPSSPITTQQLTIPLAAAPRPVPGATVRVVGNSGNSTYYYWVVSDFLIGDSQPAGPFAAQTAPNTLSAQNYVQVSFQPVQGALTYDVLRTATPAAPTGDCTCAVAIATGSGVVNDQGATLQAYTVSQYNPSLADITLTNQPTGAGANELSIGFGGVQKLSFASSGAVNYSFFSSSSPAITPTSIEGVLYADQFPGADAGAKIRACLIALGSGGGTCSAENLSGAQTVSEDIFAGVTGPVHVVFGAGTYTFTTGQNPSTWTRLSGGATNSTIFRFTPTSGTFIAWNTPLAPGGPGLSTLQAAGQGIDHITLAGPDKADPDVGIVLGGTNGATGVVIRDCILQSWGTAIQFGDNAYTDSVIDSVLELNGTGIMFPGGLTNSGEKINILGSFLGDSTTLVDIEGGGADVHMVGDSLDASATAIQMGAGSAGSSATVAASHFEAPAANPQTFIAMASGQLSVIGGSFLEDAASGTWPSMVSLTGNSNFTLQAALIQTLGLTVTNVISNSTTGLVILRDSDITVGNFTAIESSPGMSWAFGTQVLGAMGVGGGTAFGGWQVGPTQANRQCVQALSFGSSSDPYLCTAPNTDAERLIIGTGGVDVAYVDAGAITTLVPLALNGGGSIASGQTLTNNGAINGGLVNASTLEQGGNAVALLSGASFTGGITAGGGVTVPSGKRLESDGIFTVVTTTVAALPTPGNAGAGSIYVVTDAASATIGTCSGGGSTTMLAVSNGSTWTCH